MLEGYRAMWAAGSSTPSSSPRPPRRPPPPWLEEQGIPYATFGRVWDDPTFTRWVDVDGARRDARRRRHCREQGYRHHRLPRLAATARSSATTGARGGPRLRRRPGRARRAAGTPSRTSTTRRRPPPRLLTHLSPGDAVVCASRRAGPRRAPRAVRRGLEPGRDLGVVGFDGRRPPQMHHLTSVAQPSTRSPGSPCASCAPRSTVHPAPPAGPSSFPPYHLPQHPGLTATRPPRAPTTPTKESPMTRTIRTTPWPWP